MPTASTLARRPASAAISPATTPAPAMSHFMSSMPPAGLMLMPPVSKVTPLPMKAIGFDPSLAPFQRMITARGSLSLPCATPSRAPKPSFAISLGPSTSTVRPNRVSASQRRAISTGFSTLGGSAIRSRLTVTPSASARCAAHARSAAPGSAASTVRRARRGLSSGFSLVR